MLPIPASELAPSHSERITLKELAPDAKFEEWCITVDERSRKARAPRAEAAALQAAREVVEAVRKQEKAEKAAEHAEAARAREARTKDAYAVVELDRSDSEVASSPVLPERFMKLSNADKVALIASNGLGDWAAFNDWLRRTYDADELEGFKFDEDALDVYFKFAGEKKEPEQTATSGVAAVLAPGGTQSRSTGVRI